MIYIERIYSGFMGFPFLACVWLDGKILGWTTDLGLAAALESYRLYPSKVAVCCVVNRSKRFTMIGIRR